MASKSLDIVEALWLADRRDEIRRELERYRQQVLDEVREGLERRIEGHEAAARDEDPAPYKLELAKAEGIAEVLNDLNDSNPPETQGGGGKDV